MPAPVPFSTPHAQPAPYPSLYLYPLNDSFVPKHIALSQGQHVKIGRQTNAKTAPGERNGYFDSKVLSRQHAEVWEEGSKIFIKDVKSSNGTFINGERLSIEAVESEPYELKSDDIVEFGIDIVGEDNKTIIHHKVAARVVCVFSEQDAQVAARAEQHQQQQHQQQYQQAASGSSIMGQAGPSGINGAPSGFNFNNTQQRRPQLSQPGLAGMGSMGGNMRPPGKSGLTFDVILSRLQGELQKSRETGAELNTLTGAMNEIHDTLGGGLPANLPPFPSVLPPVRPPQDPVSVGASPEQPPAPPSLAASTAAITDLQAQLRDTQSSLASQLDKIHALEGVLAEQETMKQEVKTLREMIETRRRDLEHENSDNTHSSNRILDEEHDQELRGGFDLEEDDDIEPHHEDEDEDDARSIHTIVPHELERVEEEDEEQLVEEHRQDQERREAQSHEDPSTVDQCESEAETEAREERERRQSDLGRPRTPEPIRMGLRDSDSFDLRNRSSLLSARRTSASSPLAQVASTGVTADDIHEQIVLLSAQVSAVVALTSTLEAQHTAAQSTIQALETKVETLESMLKATQQAQAQIHASLPSASSTSPPSSTPEVAHEPAQERESVTEVIAEWMKSVEGKWNTVQDEWNQERERLNKAREEWEARVKQVDSGLEKMATYQASTVASQSQLRHFENQAYQPIGNGDVVKHNGLVTPPSPRSQSSDSGRYRRRRRRSPGSARGRSRSRSRSESRERDDVGVELDVSSGGLGESKLLDSFTPSRAYSPDPFTSEDKEPASGESALANARAQGHSAARSLITPEPSIYKVSSPSSISADVDPTSDQESCKAIDSQAPNTHTIHVQTAVGVLLLSVAAAAVIWKVKPE